MSAPNFTHLHVHTHYSLLDGATRIGALVNEVKAQGSGAVAVTDHGNMFASVQFYQAAVKAGIKPLMGCEVYMAPGDRREKESRGISDASYHLLLLARNEVGYRNLLNLCSIGYREGFYYRPRIDKEVLQQFSEGLVCSSACLGGEIPQALLREDARAAEEIARWYLELFGEENYYLEIQDHGLPEQKQTNPLIADLARKLGIGLIASNDVHYLSHTDVEAHDVLCCIATGKKFDDEQRFRFETDQFYLKTPQEMQALFKDYPEALDNTNRIAEMCNVELDFNTRHAPVYQVPVKKTDTDYLRDLVYEGAQEKYGEITDAIRERIDYELGVISSKGFSSYFLIVWDFVNFARRNGIPCGARGSGCSTVVGYCLGLSAPDPLRYELYFERFMDPDRDEMPDIDIDICQNGREDVINYVREKYGHVAQIITFGTLKPRAAVKDVSRVLGLGFEDANAITKLIPAELKMTIDKALAQEPDLKRMYNENPQVKKVIDISRQLEGLARHAGVHAAAVVVADKPLENFVPLYQPPNSGQVITQLDGPCVEAVGLLKMDFLGLRTLTVLERARQMAEKNHGVSLDLDLIDLGDPKVYELFVKGQTKGVFQFESGGMRDVLMKMKPNRIEDLIAANALYRPGPMEYIDAYVKRKHGEPWSTPHPVMSEVLEETYGIMVYQEQVSRLVNRLGGIELKQAFRLAKAISKKKTDMIEAMREPFVKGSTANGVSREKANEVFEDILRFGGYAFNKAHSTGYAQLAYKTAYMKVYYPTEYMAALLTFEMVSQEKVVEYIDECRQMGIDVAPLDINISDNDFTVVSRADGKKQIRFGLGAIKGVGEKAVAAIRQAREEGGPFRSVYDFCSRVDLSAVNHSVIEALIKSGSFDSTGAMRKALVAVLDDAIKLGAKAAADRRAGQMSLFGGGDGGGGLAEPTVPSGEEWSEAEMLAQEKSVLGFYVTKHPLASCQDQLRRYSTATTVGLNRCSEGQAVVLGGLISKMRTVLTKAGRNAGSKMGILTVEDQRGQVEAVLFPKALEQFQSLIKLDKVVFLKGTVDRRRETPSLLIDDVIPLEQADEELSTMILLRINCIGSSTEILAQVREVLDRYPGGKSVYLEMFTVHDLRVTIKANGRSGVRPCAEFVRDMEAILGDGHVILLGGNRIRSDNSIQVDPPIDEEPAAAADEPELVESEMDEDVLLEAG